MKVNLLRRRLDEGRLAVGHMIVEFATRGIARIVETAGVDFVVVDMEHSGIGLERVADLMAWFKATPVAPLVRVPAGHYHFIARCLDAGALGIMVPNVETLEEARSVVEAAKYGPEGRRGLGLGTAHTDYIPADPQEYLPRANAATSVICQIESTKGLENLEAIGTTAGVDVLWVGHYDLTQSMGIVGQFEHPRFVEALGRVAQLARRAGKGAGIQPGTRQEALKWFRLGYNVISFASDIGVYRTALAAGVAAVRGMEDVK